ncbi:hypothetical protein DPMN_078718 [Dreissena polymorpha]|uniref:Uncharacterized protein n=1 Tax=Dreissena polymorpha TaxID=45954 RepID=A0A9D3YSD8_DREPO|nr:hypothetical protein DPMN_078718 [Dreissena polymorpha]
MKLCHLCFQRAQSSGDDLDMSDQCETNEGLYLRVKSQRLFLFEGSDARIWCMQGPYGREFV